MSFFCFFSIIFILFILLFIYFYQDSVFDNCVLDSIKNFSWRKEKKMFQVSALTYIKMDSSNLVFFILENKKKLEITIFGGNYSAFNFLQLLIVFYKSADLPLLQFFLWQWKAQWRTCSVYRKVGTLFTYLCVCVCVRGTFTREWS